MLLSRKLEIPGRIDFFKDSLFKFCKFVILKITIFYYLLKPVVGQQGPLSFLLILILILILQYLKK